MSQFNISVGFEADGVVRIQPVNADNYKTFEVKLFCQSCDKSSEPIKISTDEKLKVETKLSKTSKGKKKVHAAYKCKCGRKSYLKLLHVNFSNDPDGNKIFQVGVVQYGGLDLVQNWFRIPPSFVASKGTGQLSSLFTVSFNGTKTKTCDITFKNEKAMLKLKLDLHITKIA